MSIAPTVESRRRPVEGRLWLAALALLGCVLLEVTVMPYISVSEGIPDLVAAGVVSFGVLRGPLVGGVAGFSAGLLLELTAPVGTLGVLAVLYLAVGWFAGRYTERPEGETLIVPLGLSVLAAGFVQVAYAGMHVLLGETVPAAYLVGHVVVPQMALTALLAPPVLWVFRRLLGSPYVLEPHAMRP